MNAAQAALIAKGFTFVEDRKDADFVVSFTMGARDKIRVNNYPVHYRGPTPWEWGAPYHTEVDVRNYTEGTLAIDIFDVQARSPVWHGWAVRTISTADRRNPTPIINDVVANMVHMVDRMNIRTSRGSLSQFNFRVTEYQGGSDHAVFVA